ncbi:hypothetical protein A3753_16545 [Sulfitobacter sp. HI0082]|jgi:uncharacterized membrane protein YcaP (DUF421 family)|uniref:DUF421 domain-containing protein n=1 Tax=unclassified Sulfitobacter TaxID=196795 RepID=UPI0007C2C827|nr:MULTISPECIES: YetF domain-containing protein [unclassified Sulfitobacter]KZZ24693.1 hypothetical protein A3753_16545 [Sulfitobacter sp. HI0082]HAC49404.1 DUF421 domain-containing protein [Sulfitobacter sp.]KZX97140.1 hypothetical protein A3720_18780 [Sulfitobacter sp. HI0021]KZX98043.1 hypothetical protein A3722_13175 [Sulfitobacter sp. HI0027]KZZ01957.1 hypothetical protein A3747_17340 [Sulfitobacter sp. HI0076]|tara:strand:+ start:1766 stop:2287 length:522 start_codon:yes stop_codon:yes gene_type:complete
MFFDHVPLDILARALLLSAIALTWVVFVVRVIGLRTFSKMTAFDFVATVATGSLLAGACQATTWPEFAQPTLAISALLGAQFVIAKLRQASDGFEEVVQNEPVILMRDGVIFDAALRDTRVARADLIAKLREANALRFLDVRAVVLETTGDISVLHGDTLEQEILEGARVIKD